MMKNCTYIAIAWLVVHGRGPAYYDARNVPHAGYEVAGDITTPGAANKYQRRRQ